MGDLSLSKIASGTQDISFPNLLHGLAQAHHRRHPRSHRRSGQNTFKSSGSAFPRRQVSGSIQKTHEITDGGSWPRTPDKRGLEKTGEETGTERGVRVADSGFYTFRIQTDSKRSMSLFLIISFSPYPRPFPRWGKGDMEMGDNSK